MAAPLIVDVRHNSLDDGPGIRTAVFFKGCPLSCVWCHNPEAISPKAELARFEKRCIACGACVKACRHGATGAGRRNNEIPIWNRERCQACFACVDGCPSGARKRAGRPMEREALVAEILKDLPFYRNSGGGVTLSGGEPMMFLEFSGRLLRNLREQGVHTIVETCGLFKFDKFVELALPYIDMIYFDVKFIDPALHARHAGAGNEVILKNLAALAAAARDKILPRVPLIPGLTATPENLRAIGAHLRSLGFTAAKLLPYNPLWPEKALAVGRTGGFRHEGFMNAGEVRECERVFQEEMAG